VITQGIEKSGRIEERQIWVAPGWLSTGNEGWIDLKAWCVKSHVLTRQNDSRIPLYISSLQSTGNN
jgi:hypothetical protein